MALLDGMKDMINSIIQNNNKIVHGGSLVDDVKDKINSVIDLHKEDVKDSSKFNTQKISDDLIKILTFAAMKMINSPKSEVLDSVKDKIDEIIKSSELIIQIKTRINELLNKGLGNDEIVDSIKDKIGELLLGNSILDELQRKIQDLLNGDAILNSVKTKINTLIHSDPGASSDDQETRGPPPAGTTGGPARTPTGEGLPHPTGPPRRPPDTSPPQVGTTGGPTGTTGATGGPTGATGTTGATGGPAGTPRGPPPAGTPRGPPPPAGTPTDKGLPGTSPPLAKTQKESLEEPNSMITRVDTVIDVINDSETQVPVVEHVEIIPWNQGSDTTRTETIKDTN